MQPEGRLSTFSLVEYYSGNPHAHLFDLLIVFILGLLILGAPLPFGSVQYLPVAAIEFLATVAFLIWIYKLVFCGNPQLLAEFRELYAREASEFARLPFFHRHYWLARVFRILTLGFWPRKNVAQNLIEDGSVAAPAADCATTICSGFRSKKPGSKPWRFFFSLLLVLQLIPLPSPLLRILSPSTADLYRTAFQTTGKNFYFFPISLDSFATFERLLRYTAYLIVFAVVVNNIRTRTLFSVILYCIFISAVFQGVYGLYEVLSGHQHIFGYRKIYNTDSATGTFINRNHYACYLELAIPLLITVTIGRFASLRSFSRQHFCPDLARPGNAGEPASAPRHDDGPGGRGPDFFTLQKRDFLWDRFGHPLLFSVLESKRTIDAQVVFESGNRGNCGSGCLDRTPSCD